MPSQNLLIPKKAGRYYSPHVDFNQDTGRCLIEGESYMEKAYDFYQVLKDWVDAYFEDGNQRLVLEFKMIFFSTGSSRAILELLLILKKHQAQGRDIKIKWHYPKPDHEEMLLDGQDFEEDSGLTFEFIEYTGQIHDDI